MRFLTYAMLSPTEKRARSLPFVITRVIGRVMMAPCLGLTLGYALHFRTMSFGLSFAGIATSILSFAMFGLVPSIIAGLGYGSRRFACQVVLLLMCVVVVTEIWAGAEELTAIWKNGIRPPTSVHIARNWPFENHGIEYRPQGGWYGSD